MTIILFEKLPETCSKEALARNEQADRRMAFLSRKACSLNFLTVRYQSHKLGPQVDCVGPRQLPRIRDLMDYAIEALGCMPTTLVGIMNSDIVLSFVGMQALTDSEADIILLSRNDVDGDTLAAAIAEDGTLTENFSSKGVNTGISADGWFCTPRAWQVLREYYPKEMLIGEPWWDTAAIHLSAAFARQFQIETLHNKHAYHPLHRGAWEDLSKEALQARNAWYNLKAMIRIGEVGGKNV